MVRVLVGLAVVGVVLASSALGQPTSRPATQPATQPVSPQVEALLGQLSSPDWRVRQKAQDQLVALGEMSVEPLKQLVRRTQDEEVRTRAEAALAQIAASERAGPTLLTLHLDNAPLAEVMAEVTKQSKADVSVWPPLERQPNPARVTLHVDRQPFWLVLREIAQQTGLSPERMGNAGRITLMNSSGRWTQKPYAVNGCFLVVADRVNLSHSIDYAQPQNAQSSFYLGFKLYVDPKLRVLRGSQQIRLEEVVDDKGNDLAPPENPMVGYSPMWGSRWMWDLNSSLRYHRDVGKRIERFRGSMRFIVQSKCDLWEINDVLNAKNLQRQAPMGKCILKSFTKSSGNSYSAQVSVEYAPNMRRQAMGNPMMDMYAMQQGLRVLDASGRPLMNAGGGGGGGGPDRADYNISFHRNSDDGQPVGEPAKLIWEIPLETQEMTVPVKFDNLPIP